jgi:AcrR family transcriptional regulator
MNTMNDTYQRILQQSEVMFLRFGLKSVSMDDISNQLGISKKTLYHHFEDKETLVVSVVSQVLNHNYSLMMADVVKSQNAIHEEILAINLMSNLFQTMNPYILFDLQKYYPKGFEIFLKHKNERIAEKCRKNLVRGIEEGLYRPEINIPIMLRLRQESLMLPFKPEFQSGLSANLVEIATEISIFFLNGIVTSKGKKWMEKYQSQHKKVSPHA